MSLKVSNVSTHSPSNKIAFGDRAGFVTNNPDVRFDFIKRAESYPELFVCDLLTLNSKNSDVSVFPVLVCNGDDNKILKSLKDNLSQFEKKFAEAYIPDVLLSAVKKNIYRAYSDTLEAFAKASSIVNLDALPKVTSEDIDVVLGIMFKLK